VLLVDRDGNGTFESASWETNVDFDKDKNADWMEVVNILKKNGWTWGGDFKRFIDRPHFEKPLGHTWRSLLKKHNAKDFIPGTTYVNL
jgi:peptidoglycan L-alanyl-D-glutamate endopeptidase CwlK